MTKGRSRPFGSGWTGLGFRSLPRTRVEFRPAASFHPTKPAKNVGWNSAVGAYSTRERLCPSYKTCGVAGWRGEDCSASFPVGRPGSIRGPCGPRVAPARRSAAGARRVASARRGESLLNFPCGRRRETGVETPRRSHARKGPSGVCAIPMPRWSCCQGVGKVSILLPIPIPIPIPIPAPRGRLLARRGCGERFWSWTPMKRAPRGALFPGFGAWRRGRFMSPGQARVAAPASGHGRIG